MPVLCAALGFRCSPSRALEHLAEPEHSPWCKAPEQQQIQKLETATKYFSSDREPEETRGMWQHD